MKKRILTILLLILMTNGAFAGSFLGMFMMRPKEFFFTKPDQELASAISWNRTGKIEKLLSKGVDVNCRGKDGITPLMWALIKGKKKSYRFLLEHGANPNLRVRQGGSTISLAAIMKDSDYLRLALKHGGDPNFVDTESDQVLIIDAIMNRRKENVDLLIQHGADLNFRCEKINEFPLMDAAMLSEWDLVHKMIMAGADIHQKDAWGHTIVFEIEQYPAWDEDQLEWREKVIEYIRAQGVDVRPWTLANGPGREKWKKKEIDYEKFLANVEKRKKKETEQKKEK